MWKPYKLKEQLSKIEEIPKKVRDIGAWYDGKIPRIFKPSSALQLLGILLLPTITAAERERLGQRQSDDMHVTFTSNLCLR